MNSLCRERWLFGCYEMRIAEAVSLQFYAMCIALGILRLHLHRRLRLGLHLHRRLRRRGPRRLGKLRGLGKPRRLGKLSGIGKPRRLRGLGTLRGLGDG